MFSCFSLFFFNDTATSSIYTLSLHDALPISRRLLRLPHVPRVPGDVRLVRAVHQPDRRSAAVHGRERLPRRSPRRARSEEHTSELQSQSNLVCRLLLEKKKNTHAHPAEYAET